MAGSEPYPDTLTYEGPDGLVEVKCRFVPYRGNRLVRSQDGTESQQQFDVAFPFGTTPIPQFTIVSGFDRSGYQFILDKELATFHIGQLHCKGVI